MHLLIPAFMISSVIWGALRVRRAIVRRGLRWTARGSIVAAVSCSLAGAVGLLMLAAAVAGEQGPPTIRLVNDTGDTVWLAVPHAQPDERSSAGYHRVGPGEHVHVARERTSATNWRTCVGSRPGALLTIDGWTERTSFRSADGQRRVVDPPAEAVTVLVDLPAGRCFEDRDPWLAFDGAAVVPTHSRDRGPVEILLWIASPGLVAVGAGALVDVLIRRRRSTSPVPTS